MRARASYWLPFVLLTSVAMLGALGAPRAASAQAGDLVTDAGPPDANEPQPAASTMEASVENAEQIATPESGPDEAELAVLADVQSVAADAPSLQIYGFADLSIFRAYLDKQSPYRAVAPGSSFAIGNVNVYLASNLTHGFSSLLEVRLTYMPSGSFDPTGKIQTTYSNDPSSFGRSDRWGGIILQRVHLDYSYSGLLNVRIGQFLTPYGIWNVDHGSPTVISTIRPYPIGNAYFPERQTGMEVFGSHLIKNTTVGYHLTLSNGRGDVEFADFDENKALGARLFVATDTFGSLKVGLSAYGGRATREVSVSITPGAAQPTLKLVSANQYDEFALAADLLWEWRNLRIQGEAIMSQLRYTDGGRRLRTVPFGAPLGLVADHVAWAWYGLVGYRFSWLSTMPFVLLDQFHHAPGAGPYAGYEVGNSARGYTFGLNVRPIPSVVLKAQVTLVRVPTTPYSDSTLVGGQAAWAF